ncbi:TIGR02678 family protein [Streptomyces sp. CB03911]|uniref:TIGR02678 family protein n=1 Tax=Streptomyces sp. CB03911 TaxID=1804758 RepID=UPI00093B7669|nr:TIGR02678 family protein [Streptomyces sp. CB03911]OKI31050.1 hypothetical protein A6A07_03170 [Streptomyces sp. CB03911]
MDQQEHGAGTVRVPGGTSDGRTGGAGRGATDACVAVRDSRPDGEPGGLPGRRPAAGRPPGPAGLDGTPDPGLLRLAGWFAEASEESAHDLFTAAFGLYGARHFGARSGPQAPGPRPPVPDAPGADGTVSWWHGPSAHAPAARLVREARPLPGLRRARRTAGVAVEAAAPAGGRRGKHRKPEPAPAPAGPQERSAAAERRIAARLLLAHPLITAAGPHGEGFPLIRRHRDWLTERFDTLLGYRLVVGPWHARLGKAGLGPGGARRLEHPGSGTPFTPGEYAQLAVALSVLVDAPERLPLGRLVAAVRAASPLPAAGRGPGPEADLAGALRVLTDWQVLSATGSGLDTLDPTAELTVDQELARALPAGPPALAADAEDLVRRAAEAADPGTAVRRRLAETPVVLHDDLPGAERAWLAEQWHTVAGTFADFLGLEAELRTEGVALLDPADELTDLALPGTGTLARAALLLVERLVEELRPLPGEPTAPAVPIPDALIDGALGDIADEYGLRAGWRRDYLADRTALRRDALDLLARMGLIAPTPRGTYPPGWLLRAPAARYAPEAELLPAPGTGRHSRRDGEDCADDEDPAGPGERGGYDGTGGYEDPAPYGDAAGFAAPVRAGRPDRTGQAEAVVPPARGPSERPQQLPA